MRALVTSACALLVSLLLAVPAFALDNGDGIYGKTDDKIVTNAAFLLMIFFTVTVIVLSLAQHFLGKRKGPK